MTITLRPATAADAKKIKDLIHEVRINPMNLDWERFIVAEDDGEFVGCAQVKPHTDGVRELASLAVSPSWQGQGIGSMLVKALLEREKGELYLMCRAKTAPYYRRFGFVEVVGKNIPRSFRLHARAGRLIAMFAGEGIAFMKRKAE
ncbi:MAG: GNAT family N-acetyltransferase [Chloroflexi bacterium]|nr:GNAT family N-acetyltransferase [Chloroflexota bacterium]